MDGTILIIDNSEYEREKIKIILENIGEFKFIELENLKQCDKAVKDLSKISLIIMDIAFPVEKDGFEVLSMLRKCSLTSSVPVIIVTKSDNSVYKQTALKYNVGDFVIKPYDTKRLENSIRSVMRIEQKFRYDFNSAHVITMSIEDYITKEFKVASRANQNISIVFITPINIKKDLPDVLIDSELKNTIYSVAAEKAKLSSRSTDTIILNDEKDILAILPFTDSIGAQMVLKKITSSISEGLKELSINYDDYFYAVHVTSPTEGKSFQSLMEKASKKVEAKIMLEKMTSIGSNVLDHARRTYKRFTP